MSEGILIDAGTNDLLVEIKDRVAILTLNRPEARNALSDSMIEALCTLIKRFGDDPRVGSILITGAGNAFCAGGDVKGMSQGQPQIELTFEERVAELRVQTRMLLGALVELRKPTVAAIRGHAAGAGLPLALACDIRIAAESAMLTTAYARIGLAGDYGVSWLLMRLVGFSRARELLFLSERVGARRAEALGLVNRVVPDEEFAESAFALAATLAAGAPVAFSFMKDNLDHAMSASFCESLDFEAENHIKAKQTYDYQEGLRAFMEKRKPAFEGR